MIYMVIGETRWLRRSGKFDLAQGGKFDRVEVELLYYCPRCINLDELCGLFEEIRMVYIVFNFNWIGRYNWLKKMIVWIILLETFWLVNIFVEFVDWENGNILLEREEFNRLHSHFNRMIVSEDGNDWLSKITFTILTLVNEASYWFPRWYRSNHVNCLPTYIERLERGHSYPGHWFQSTFF